jgi:hypothetical protein
VLERVGEGFGADQDHDQRDEKDTEGHEGAVPLFG